MGREVVERGLPELLASAAAGAGGPGASLVEQLSALQPAAFRCLLAAARAATRACLHHSCMCVAPPPHRSGLDHLDVPFMYFVEGRHSIVIPLS